MATKIEWAEETWNPIVGCNPISPGCKNCYAERMAYRLSHALGKIGTDVSDAWVGYSTVIGDNKKWNGKTDFVHSALDKPLHWKKPRTIFICSMGDLFHESVLFEWIDDVFGVMTTNPQHTYLILTKRPERMYDYIEYMNQNIADAGFEGYDPPSFIWLGVTAENQEQADKRIPILLSIPAAKRFVSIEPMLGPVDLRELRLPKSNFVYDSILGRKHSNYYQSDWYSESSNKLDWIITGSESGPGRRPMNQDWVRSLRDQCITADVPFLLKQMPINGKLVKMPELDGKVWNQKPKS